MKIAIAQMNPVIGAIKANTQSALALCERAQALGAQMVVFPELYLSGYPPKDLLLREDFLASVQKNALFFAQNSPLPALMGAPWRDEPFGLPYNACLWLYDGKIKVISRKRLLPTYNIFDEARYFSVPKTKACDSFEYLNKRFLVSICEDAWNTLPVCPVPYDFDPVALGFKESPKIDFFINISASPYSADKPTTREKIFSHIASTYAVPVLVAAQVGGNDQLLFDGQSLIIDPQGLVVARAHACKEDLLIFDSEQSFLPCPPRLDSLLLTRDALVMGMRDYVEKCGAKGLVIGLSGGIDSAVCAALAVRALGSTRVKACFMASKYSSKDSLDDAQKIADNLGLNLEKISIEPAVQVIRDNLSPFFQDARPINQDLGDQNIQSRMRGLMLMGICNALDYFMVATSNKSELAVGYGTIYGDMCGAFAPLGDLYKTEVWRLARVINQEGIIIPESIITKAPTAELKANQIDQDSLPDYALLDKILSNYIDLDLSIDNIFNKTKININIINQVISLVNNSEYKRRQAPFPLMVSNKVFGEARRLPIAKRLEL